MTISVFLYWRSLSIGTFCELPITCGLTWNFLVSAFVQSTWSSCCDPYSAISYVTNNLQVAFESALWWRLGLRSSYERRRVTKRNGVGQKKKMLVLYMSPVWRWKIPRAIMGTGIRQRWRKTLCTDYINILMLLMATLVSSRPIANKGNSWLTS